MSCLQTATILFAIVETTSPPRGAHWHRPALPPPAHAQPQISVTLDAPRRSGTRAILQLLAQNQNLMFDGPHLDSWMGQCIATRSGARRRPLRTAAPARSCSTPATRAPSPRARPGYSVSIKIKRSRRIRGGLFLGQEVLVRNVIIARALGASLGTHSKRTNFVHWYAGYGAVIRLSVDTQTMYG